MTLQTQKTDADKTRHAMLDLGWDVRPSVGKQIFLPKWNNLGTVTHDTIDAWTMLQFDPIRGEQMPAVSTGIRLGVGMIALDADVPDDETSDAIYAMIAGVLGDARTDAAPIRDSGGAKFMMLLRCDPDEIEAKVLISPDFVDEEGGKNQFEVYTGAHGGKFFGLFGPHSYAPDGQVAKAYKWHERVTPATVSPGDLPLVTWQEVMQIQMRATDILGERLRRVETSESVKIGRGAPDRLFDLSRDAIFHTAKHGDLTYEDALDAVADGEAVSCSGGCLDGARHANRTRCTLSEINGALAVFDFQSGQLHLPADVEAEYDGTARAARTRDLGAALKRIKPALVDATLAEAAEAGADTDAFEEVVGGLMESLAYNRRDGTVTRLDDRSGIWSGVAVATIKTELLADNLRYTGPNGGPKSYSPVSAWAAQPDRITISGTRFDPTRDRIFTDDFGATYANAFFGLPDLGAGSDREADGVLDDFMRHLVPDDVERDWLYQWIADKYHNPQNRNCAVIFVAANVQGTGRGTFFGIMRKLLDGYTQIVSETNILSGRFNQHLEGNLMTFTNEMGGLDYRTRKSGYETLKDRVDPTHSEVSIERKGKEVYTTMTYVSTILATNGPDALVLDPADRRFAVITNGRKLYDNQPLLARIKAVCADKDYTRLGAALARRADRTVVTAELADAPLFDGRDLMLEANETDLDAAIAKVIDEAAPWRSWSRSDFEKAVKLEMTGSDKSKVGGLRSVVSGLVGDNGRRAGAYLHSKKIAVASDAAAGGRSVVSVVSKNVEYLMSCTEEGRRKILHGLKPDDDDTNIVPIKGN